MKAAMNRSFHSPNRTATGTAKQSPQKQSKSVPRAGVKRIMGKRKYVPGPEKDLEKMAAVVHAYSPHETFQMISTVDEKLQKKGTKGIFDDEAEHNAKRQVLLERARQAKLRIDAQKRDQPEGVNHKPSFELIEEQLELEKAEEFLKVRRKRKGEYYGKHLKLIEKNTRKWMVQKGKGGLLDFQDDQIRKLQECFNSLDDDGSGSIGVDEIKGPLIGLGLVNSLKEVEKLVEEVDEDGSQMIEFDEFLQIVLNKHNNEEAMVITNFFKNLTNGQYQTNGLAFPNWVLSQQRRTLLDAIELPKEDERRGDAVKIMNAIKQMHLDEKKEEMKDEM